MSPLPYTVSLDEFGELLLRFPFERSIRSIHLRGRHRPSPQTEEDPCHAIVLADGILLNRGTWTWRLQETDQMERGAKDAFVIDVVCGADGKLSGFLAGLVFQVVARALRRFDLPLEAVVLLPESKDSMEASSGVRLALNLAELPTVLRQLEEEASTTSGPESDFPFPRSVRSVWTLIDQVRSNAPSKAKPIPVSLNPFAVPFSSPAERGVPPSLSENSVRPAETRAIELTPSVKQDLRAHVINLAQGRFSQAGWKTPREDVDTIFRKHIPDWALTRPAHEKLRIVIYAHGGIVDEKKGLQIAAHQTMWWKDNGAYPLFFVWETGLLETLAQLINPDRPRDIDFAAPTDFLLEQVARRWGGVVLWSGMKRSAERASDNEGGATYTAKELVNLLRGPLGPRLELHAIGHSAGSIFHGHFINAALRAGIPEFQSLTLLAPAITLDAFKEQLLPPINERRIKHTVMFTLARPYELDDHCMTVYRKSLLYLIRGALEPDSGTPLLGLEESIREDPLLMELFNPDGPTASRSAEIVFSSTKTASGRCASQSTSHGGFDDDPATMESVARRILDRDDIKPFPVRRDLDLRESSPALAKIPAKPLQPPLAQAFDHNGHSPNASAAPSTFRNGSTGSKRALCVGIDRYRDSPLRGCVNDALQWENALGSLGFSTEMLLDEDATRDTMLERLSALVKESRAGDEIVFQYAGHGTQLPDLDADEDDSYDEALCPFDYTAGRYVIDDDLADVFDRIPDGVNVTVFTDCCHSGTISRLAIGRPSPRSREPNRRVRFMVTPAELEVAHRRDRERLGRSRAVRSSRGYQQAKEVLFCACRATELAQESNGHGDFTSRAIPLLLQAKPGVTHEEFAEAVLKTFDPSADQHPELHCSPERRAEALFTSRSDDRPTAAVTAGVSTATIDREAIRRAFELAAESLR